jgi:hypothetical protein
VEEATQEDGLERISLKEDNRFLASKSDVRPGKFAGPLPFSLWAPWRYPMSKKFSEIVNALNNLVESMERAEQEAGRWMKGVNTLLARLGASGFVNHTVVLGPVIHQRGYAPPRGIWEVGEVIQAALLVPQGIGVVVWDVEEFLNLRGSEQGLEGDAAAHFVPFEECDLALRALLLPRLPALLEKFGESFPPPVGDDLPADSGEDEEDEFPVDGTSD